MKKRTLFHVTFDKEQALYLLRKLLTYGVYVEAYVKDKIFGMYPPSRCITPERLSVLVIVNRLIQKGSVGLMDNHLPSLMNHPQLDVPEGHLPGETHDHYALAEGDEAANDNLSECEVEQSNFFFRPNIRPFILATRTMVCDLLAHMESLDEGPEKIKYSTVMSLCAKESLQDLRDEYQGMSHDGTGRERFYDVLLSSEGNLEFVLPHTTKGPL